MTKQSSNETSEVKNLLNWQKSSEFVIFWWCEADVFARFVFPGYAADFLVILNNNYRRRNCNTESGTTRIKLPPEVYKSSEKTWNMALSFNDKQNISINFVFRCYQW